jgi:predicted TIM-barrel fold metal-dependent hydrolase
MSDLLFFDAYTQVGPRVRKHPAHPWKLEDVLAEMDHCSVSAALVASTTSVSYDLMYSNLELSQRLSGRSNLYAIWNVMPHQSGEFPAPEKLAKLADEHGVRAVTLYPKTNAWDLEAQASRALLSWLARRRMLTIIERAELASFRDLENLLKRYPELPVLLIGASWTEQRLLIPLLRQYRSLHIAFDHFQIHYGPEYLTQIGCEDQLVFASRAPIMSMGAHRCYIDYADVPLRVRQKIAGGNLLRLLGRLRPPRLNINKNEDALMAAARRGEPLPVPVIDLHMHMLHEGLEGAGGGYRMHRGGPSGIFRLLKRLGCVGGGFMSWNGIASADSLAGNACVRAALDAAPRGYWGLASFDPVHYTQPELRRLIPEGHADRRFIGMKPYVTYGVEYHHRSYDTWWQYGSRAQLYALLHRTRGDFVEVDTLAKKYPRIRWVVAHCGADYKTADMVIESMRKHRNVYAEITLTPVTCGVIDYLAEHGDVNRVVYGSDLPMRDPRQQLGWVVFSRLPLSAKKKILCGNALRVIAPCLKRLPPHSRPLV